MSGPSTRRRVPRAYLRAAVLLELGHGPAHGYELLERVHDLGVESADAGGLYRTLRAMEQDGLLRSWWEPSQTGPARRSYELTAAGAAALEESMDDLAAVARRFEVVLARYRALAVRQGTR